MPLFRSAVCSLVTAHLLPRALLAQPRHVAPKFRRAPHHHRFPQEEQADAETHPCQDVVHRRFIPFAPSSPCRETLTRSVAPSSPCRETLARSFFGISGSAARAAG